MYWELPHSESLTDCSEFTSLLAAATVLPLSSCADMKAFYDTHIDSFACFASSGTEGSGRVSGISGGGRWMLQESGER